MSAPALPGDHVHVHAAGQQATVTGPDNSTWTFGYDLLGRKTSQSDPDAGTSSYGYDDAGNQVSSTDARGVELDYTYDLLGRKLSGTDKTTGFEFGTWLYDTQQIGQPTSSTSYVPGVTGGYTVASTGYTSLGKPYGTKFTLPSSEAPLPTSYYSTTYTYTTNDQLLSTQTDPSVAYLSAETIGYQHDTLGNPTVSSDKLGTYVAATSYTAYGEPLQVTYGPSTNAASATYTYDDQTRRLTNTLISRTQAPGPAVDSTTYTYDAAGNLTSDTDTQSETGTTITDQQCYSYDALDRLTTAWTANGSCSTAPAAGTSGDLATGAGSYWQSYSYDSIGDRNGETDYSTTTGTSSTTTYVDGCTTSCTSTGAQPHTLTATTGGTTPTAFTYDADGNLATRTPTTGNGQKLTFNDQGELSEADTVNSGGTTTAKTSYVYDANGNELIRRDPGQTTLFAGDTEIVVNTSVTPNALLGAVRSYTSGGTGNPVAIRSSLGSVQVLDYEFTDPHGTATLEMDATTQKVARQEFTPYGVPRANANGTSWNDPTRGYLDKPQDTSTGYADVGARKYDPTLGRFISDDPKLETTSPQQLGGYTYAADNPTTGSDPTGRIYLSNGRSAEALDPEGAAAADAAPAGYIKINDPDLPVPEEGATPEFLREAGEAQFTRAWSTIADAWRENPWARGISNIYLEQVDVEINGMQVPRVVGFVSRYGIKIPGLQDALTKLNVVLYKAQMVPKGDPDGHSEAAAKAVSEDIGEQEGSLGGPMVEVNAGLSTIPFCQPACAQNAADAAGMEENPFTAKESYGFSRDELFTKASVATFADTNDLDGLVDPEIIARMLLAGGGTSDAADDEEGP